MWFPLTVDHLDHSNIFNLYSQFCLCLSSTLQQLLFQLVFFFCFWLGWFLTNRSVTLGDYNNYGGFSGNWAKPPIWALGLLWASTAHWFFFGWRPMCWEKTICFLCLMVSNYKDVCGLPYCPRMILTSQRMLSLGVESRRPLFTDFWPRYLDSMKVPPAAAMGKTCPRDGDWRWNIHKIW